MMLFVVDSLQLDELKTCPYSVGRLQWTIPIFFRTFYRELFPYFSDFFYCTL